MSRYLCFIAAFFIIIAGCGKDSGPPGPALPQLAKYDLVGEWQGTAKQFKLKTDTGPSEDFTYDFNSLDCLLIIADETYQLEAYHSDANMDFSLMEEGRWSWFKETGEYLFFDALESSLVTAQRQRSQQGEMTVRSNASWGKRSWKCKLEYDPDLKTITLFNIDDIFDFGKIVLTKR